MTGRITQLIDDQQFGSIATDDGNSYVFGSDSLIDVTFGALHVGAFVTFEPSSRRGRVTVVRLTSDVERLR
jgi:cold shock CspA family protein